ncbi:major facilitator superfamily transporter multidrug:cation transporter [Enterococcus faecium]|nr:major facilitator superfamily transporter multidrug:cation transporter [Enterococcus faecium]
MSGYIPNATAMIASQAPREKSGWALGTLSTGAIAGNLIGPSMGGALAQWFGMENVFLITGALLMITTVLTIFLVKEDFHPIEKKDLISTKEIFSKMDHLSILIGLFITTLILQIGITTISPILTLYIRELSGSTENILFVSGLIVSIAGVSAVFSSPKLGKLGDKIGNQKVLIGGLILSFCCYLSMAFVTTPLQLGILRFILGFSTGALMPSVNTLISKITPQEGVSRIYSYNQMFSNFGQVLGPMLGSTVAHAYNYSAVFIVTSLFVLSNILLSLFNFRKVLRSRL